MRRLQPSEFSTFIKNNVCAILFSNPIPCDRCDAVKKVLNTVQQELPLVPIVYFEEAANVYPLNELSKQLKFNTVPTVVIFKNATPVTVIKSVNTPNIYVDAIKNVQA